MERVIRNEIDFSEIFSFADKKFGISWNDASDLFFDSVLRYKKFDDFDLKELEAELAEDDQWNDGGVNRKGKTIIKAFMKKHKLREMRVFNDC